ncbi:hypothetical protein [Paracoccus tibetensis]|uniref:Uncharacterized protein n=1 Tax=Paracoccus tibetensis TaxID=336292 RepID=A0A1G5EC43_9RHOB|nr:hypothetical protein [Paracoccus tibetensis]SCY24559.1 hypothetical protein SAMN05660710_01032 [Paracoccus tibetensis]
MPTNNDSIERLRREHGTTDAPDQPATVEALRRDIDSGATGDKVNYPDPAAAPLGADDEAGGHSPNREEMRMAREAGAAAASDYVAPVPGVDHSASEAGQPADMDYYREDNATGSSLALTAVAMPIVLLLLIVFGALWYWM